MSKIQKAGYSLVELIVVLGGVAMLATIGLVIYVAVHFIQKFW